VDVKESGEIGENVEVIEDTTMLEFGRSRGFTMLGTPLLESGRSTKLLALAPQLWVHAKVHAGGGERELHSHPNEDHAFFVLAGRARFYDAEHRETEISAYEGIMIPRGVRYSFDVVGDENLVILRIGAAELSGTSGGRLLAKQARSAPGAKPSPRNGIPIPGAVFAGLLEPS
jgi:mannose-6-phosphate isomerase-like protein (cupin superfamily)